MSPTPLFVTDRATLLADLRLGNIPTSNSATAVIDSAMRKARVGLHLKLGPVLVAALSAVAYVEDPTTDADIRRSTASLLEIALVRLELVGDLGVAFADGSGDLDESWDASAPFFKARKDKPIDKLKTEIRNEIETYVDYLKSSTTPGEAETIRATVFGATETEVDIHAPRVARAPGSTIFTNTSVRDPSTRIGS